MIGASLLWFGWFGFNAGSALEANGTAAPAFMNTYLATACAVLSWMFAEWLVKGKPSMLGAASGAVAGLVAITPAAGNVGIPGAFVIGLGGGRGVPVSPPTASALRSVSQCRRSGRPGPGSRGQFFVWCETRQWDPSNECDALQGSLGLERPYWHAGGTLCCDVCSLAR
jgi:Ammonium Transporter Family